MIKCYNSANATETEASVQAEVESTVKEKKKFKFNFDFLQKLGKVLMTVIAVMPAAGLMISVGKLVAMAGADLDAIGRLLITYIYYLQQPLAVPGQRNVQVVHLRQS